ncbi:hypothetical protein ABZY10_34705 [Streptomyces sp. NPDC006539]|uniref:hypothetical protein n=1 Tax=Streptomyces sp. NPDC006539 TaxID=3155352 RepID=UPI0033B55B77
MSVNGISKPNFIVGYTRILTRAWSSEDFCKRLESDPQSVLSENGLETPENAFIEVVRSRDAEPDLNLQISMWRHGDATGKYILYVPYLPQMDMPDLNDEDLGDLAGGAAGCCCSPCCCQSE